MLQLKQGNPAVKYQQHFQLQCFQKTIPLSMSKIGSSDETDYPPMFAYIFKTFEKIDAFTGVVITLYRM